MLIALFSSKALAGFSGEVLNENSLTAAQQIGKTVTGKVTDENGPIIGASVTVKGTSNGIITDIEGQFT